MGKNYDLSGNSNYRADIAVRNFTISKYFSYKD